MINLEKPSLNELAHYGVLGMKWGVRKERETSTRASSPKLTYQDRAKADYTKRGFSEADSETLAERKANIRRAALIAGGVTVAVGAAFVARHLYIENKDMTLKAGKKAYHIARGELKPLEPGRGLFVTVDQADRYAYRWRLNNPNKVERIERTFKFAKDIKIPSPNKSKALYNEFMKDPANKKVVKEAFVKMGGGRDADLNYRSFVTYGPYFSKGESWHKFTSNNPAGESIWNGYKNFLTSKGFQGILDANDRARDHGFNVERPTILFDAAANLKEVARTSLGKEMSITKMSIPTIRELGSVTTAKYAAAAAGIAGISVSNNSKALNSYRRVHPNSSKSNKEIIQILKNDPILAYDVHDRAARLTKGRAK